MSVFYYSFHSVGALLSCTILIELEKLGFFWETNVKIGFLGPDEYHKQQIQDVFDLLKAADWFMAMGAIMPSLPRCMGVILEI